MSLIEMMENRRSVRAFNSEPVTDEELNKILQAAMLAPNGKGLKPWSFVTIRDEKTLRDLVNCRKGGAKMLETATAAIAVYSDSDVTDTFIEDSSLVMGWMHLMASDLGLGSCWLQLRLRPSNEEGVSAEEFVNRRLNAPDNQKAEALLVMGHIDETPIAHELPELPCGKVHAERW